MRHRVGRYLVFWRAAHRTSARLDQDPHGRQGIFCTSQQEDNAIYEALKRGAGAKLLDLDRVAVLRAGSDFLRPYDGQSSADNLVHYAAQGGFPIALENLYRSASPLVQQIVNNWPTWRRGVPAP